MLRYITFLTLFLVSFAGNGYAQQNNAALSPIIVDLKSCSVAGSNEIGFISFKASNIVASYSGGYGSASHTAATRQIDRLFEESGLTYLVEQGLGATRTDDGVTLSYDSRDDLMSGQIRFDTAKLITIPQILPEMPANYVRRLFAQEISSYNGPVASPNGIYMNLCDRFPAIIYFDFHSDDNGIYGGINLLINDPQYGNPSVSAPSPQSTVTNSACDHVYVGQRFKGKERLGGIFTIGVTYEVLGFSAASEAVSIRSTNGGNSYNITCAQVTP